LKEWLENGVPLDQVFQELKTDALLHANDLKQWYKDNVLKIKLLTQAMQSQLINEIKAGAAAATAALKPANGAAEQRLNA